MELQRTTPGQYEKLIKLGFPINTASKHPTPTVAFALKWLREIKFILIETNFDFTAEIDAERKFWFSILTNFNNKYIEKWSTDAHRYNIYEQAEIAGLDYAIEYLLTLTKN